MDRGVVFKWNPCDEPPAIQPDTTYWQRRDEYEKNGGAPLDAEFIYDNVQDLWK